MLSKSNYTLLISVCFLCICFTQVKAQTTADTYMIEAEEFQFPDKWLVSNEIGVSGSKILSVGQTAIPNGNAYTAIEVQTAGTYDVWTRSSDYPDNRPGTRRFLMYINEVAMSQESGAHGQQGYYWEKVGTAVLNVGEALLRIKDTRGYYGRCDAIILTKLTAFNPNSVTLNDLKDFKISPKILPSSPTSSQAVAPYRLVNDISAVNAEISNGKLKLSFVTVLDETNAPHIVSTTSIFKDGEWLTIDDQREANRVFLLNETNPSVNYMGVYPAWENEMAKITFQSLGQTFSVFDQAQARNPFSAGQLLLCNAITVEKISNQELKVKYTTDSGEIIYGTWKLALDASHLSLALDFKAQTEGYYSFGVTALQPINLEAVKNVQLPPMFQYQRLPDQPLLVPSALTPQPVSIVETTINNQEFSFFISGALSNYPLEWATGETSPFGFSLKNESNKVQPISFAPILGFADSKLNVGQSLQREFEIGAVCSTWDNALEYFSNQVYQVKDYRQQLTTSLTNSAINMVDLINSDVASGWDSTMKGFYDIEMDPVIAPVVVNTSTLTLLSSAVMSKDENMYIKRALPAIEYTLSRRGYRWSNKEGTLFTPTASSLRLSPYSKEFNVAYFEGLDKLLNNANPWIKDLALPNGELRATSSWSEKLAAYRLTQSANWLNAAIRSADDFLINDVYGVKTDPLGANGFYNVTYYPNWWDLVDIYEVTKDSKYLAAAEKSAFYTIAGLRSYPKVTANLQTIHPGNSYNGTTTIWWKGSEKYRLGFPRTAGDVQEKQIQQDIVSPIGLGFEQPTTLFFPKDPILHVYMSNWSPNLLRVFQYNNREIFQTYARNSIIGRFSNYPGYYARGFTDLPMKPDYPYTGPDVTSMYYHHIPSQLAFTHDFLITEAMQRSQGNINFPYSRQEGFVWFNNRIFGGGKGKIYSDKEVSLYFKKDLVTLDNPAVNYITAISDNKFWVVLLNESPDPSVVNLILTNNVNVASNSVAEVYSNDDCISSSLNMNGREINTTLNQKNAVAISFPLTNPIIEAKIPKVENGMQTVTVDNDWGKFYVFRIRSPFGWDSIYAYLDTPPLENAKANLQTNINNLNIERVAYPYEWSVQHIAYNTDVVLDLALTLNGVIKNVSVTINGTEN
ncbi:hypothetical protein [Pedobacter arcticus]|uniref:hypothetical protein n=1 Tax=Pedobacter arcticus TaxID=752140 RepID=UPI00030C38D3|nr:hypothetical protein [Pedobacter arcticus]